MVTAAIAHSPPLAELTKLANEMKWSKADVTDLWNANAKAWGVKPVKRMRNRGYGLERVWSVLKDKKDTEVKPEAPAAKPARQRAESNGEPREGSKAAKAIELMKRDGGVSGAELEKKLGWLPHVAERGRDPLPSRSAQVRRRHEQRTVSELRGCLPASIAVTRSSLIQ